ncbi:MAG: ABC transporter ATP-binding protein/permease [Oscillospiraceae bacterium]|nr:ABC transporter ATP-binding protein/permease [Oscillospiraceae bacterium]
MKKLFSYLSSYKKESILGPLFKLLEAAFDLMVPVVVAQMIDVGIKNSDSAYIMKMCGVLLLLAAVGFACSITAQYFAAKASAGFAKKLKQSLFGHINTLSFSEIDELGTSSLITRMTSDMNQLQSAVNLGLRLLLRSPFIVFGAMIMAFTIDVKAALVFVVAIPLLAAVVFGIMIGSIPLYKKVQQKLDKVMLRTRENLTGVRVIRAFGKEEAEKQAFDEENEALVAIQKFAGKISALMNPVTYVLINLAAAVLIYIGGQQTDAGMVTQGEVVALYNYMSQILVELIKLASLIITMTKAAACWTRINSVFGMKPGIEYPDTLDKSLTESADEAVRFENVGMTYKNAPEEALTGISFTVKRGETVGVIGSTGSGQSTLVNLIPRLYDVSTGSVYVNGINVKEYPKDELRRKIGIVLQKAVLFRGTIRENIKWGNETASDSEIMAAVTTAQAADVVNGKKGGLDHMIEQGGRNLSGGQRQRLTIARAIVRRPEILILDDSASALDYATDAKLRKSISELDYSPTVFIVSQRTASVMNADKIIVLEDGRISAMGTHEELLKTSEVYNEIYSSQFKKEVG